MKRETVSGFKRNFSCKRTSPRAWDLIHEQDSKRRLKLRGDEANVQVVVMPHAGIRWEKES